MVLILIYSIDVGRLRRKIHEMHGQRSVPTPNPVYSARTNSNLMFSKKLTLDPSHPYPGSTGLWEEVR
jgi:hypothetical protein